MKTLLLYTFTGLAAGFINGLFGTGGALPLLALFTLLSYDTDKAFATANLGVMVLSAVSLGMYLKNGTLDTAFLPHFFSSLFFPALAGGTVGSLLLSRVSPTLLKRIFFLVIAVGGIGKVIG